MKVYVKEVTINDSPTTKTIKYVCSLNECGVTYNVSEPSWWRIFDSKKDIINYLNTITL